MGGNKMAAAAVFAQPQNSKTQLFKTDFDEISNVNTRWHNHPKLKNWKCIMQIQDGRHRHRYWYKTRQFSAIYQWIFDEI